MSRKKPTAKELHSALIEAMAMARSYAKRIAPEVEEAMEDLPSYEHMRDLVNNWRDR